MMRDFVTYQETPHAKVKARNIHLWFDNLKSTDELLQLPETEIIFARPQFLLAFLISRVKFNTLNLKTLPLRAPPLIRMEV